MAVIKDVAKLAGVSVSTVSKFLHNPENLRENKRIAVEDAIKKLDYKPNLFARNLRVQDSRTIAVIAQEIDNPFHATLYNTIRKEAAKQNYSVVLYSVDDMDGDIDKLMRDIPAGYFSGIIIGYFQDMDKSADFAGGFEEVPLVMMSSIEKYTVKFGEDRIVFCDFKRGTYQAIDYLVESGIKDIAYIGCAYRKAELDPKVIGFYEAMDKHGLTPHSVTRLKKRYTIESGYESAQIALTNQEHPQAFLVDNDIMCFGVLRCLKDYNIKVPSDIAVISFDDIDMARYYTPALTTVHLPIVDMSRCAWKKLYNQIEKDMYKDVKDTFIPHLIIRETT